MDDYGDWSERKEKEFQNEIKSLKPSYPPKLEYTHEFPALTEEVLHTVWERWYTNATVKWGTRTRAGMEAIWDTESKLVDV